MFKLEFDEADVKLITDKVLEGLSRQLVLLMQRNIVEEDIVVTGMLLNSCEYRKGISGYEAGNTAPYAHYVEYGQPPHWPNYEAILDWVIRKKKETGEMAKRAAWRICRAIAKRGLKPRLFMAAAVMDLVRKYG